MASSQRVISYDEVCRHNTADDCWVVLHGAVYDLTAFNKRHPGGSKLITAVAGLDGTEHFAAVHVSLRRMSVLSTARRLFQSAAD